LRLLTAAIASKTFIQRYCISVSDKLWNFNACLVCLDEFEILRNAGQQNIVFFTIHDPETLLPPSTRLHPLAGNTTDQEPLVIWHPLSNINSK
jgi:hypothetical protein